MLPEEDLIIPFGKDQIECLPFRTKDGFGAVFLDLIEGFAANSNGTSAVFIKGSGENYNVTDTVPQLVKRFAFFMEKRRLRDLPQVSGAPQQEILHHAEATPETSAQESPAEALPEAAARPVVLIDPPKEPQEPGTYESRFPAANGLKHSIFQVPRKP